jgi:hypothetical protein
MSDDTPAGWQPPLPPPPPTPTPPGTYPGSYPTAGFPGGLPGAPPAGWVPSTKPPRPAVPIAGLLMIAGAVVIVVGTVLPWMKVGSTSLNAWDVLVDVEDESSRGGGYTFFAVVLGGFGITTLAARRVLPVAILAVIFGAFAVLLAITDLADLYDLEDLIGIEIGVGPWITLLGAAAALGGAIWTLSVRRKWRPAST